MPKVQEKNEKQDNAELESIKNNFDKLKAGCLFRSLNKENNEPENIAVGQISKELRFLQRQSEYANEIERVLKELRITVGYIRDCRTKELPTDATRQELLAYYQGIFLTLVHQMKDKITLLINLMTEVDIPEKPDKENDISVLKLLQKKEGPLKSMRIYEEVARWDQNHKSSKIAVALRIRTSYHHRISTLRHNKHYQNLNLTDIATQPSFRNQLSDYGKKQMDTLYKESAESLFVDALKKAEATLEDVEENIKRISLALVDFFKLPITNKEVAKIVEEHSRMLSSFDVTNRCLLDKIPEPHNAFLSNIVKGLQEKYKEIISIYLVGSLARGEYEEGYSDINIYIVLDVEDEQGQSVEEKSYINIRAFTRKNFLSSAAEKYRIIAKADGLLLFGEDLVKDEKPKASLFLALKLNNDIIELMDQSMKWAEENPDASVQEISKKSRQIAKRFIDFVYGVVMSNKPQYTSSRAERIERINEMYPENIRMMDIFSRVIRSGVGELESFKNMIEGFRPNVEKNLKRMQEVSEGINKQNDKK